MSGAVERVKQTAADVQRRAPWVEHAITTLQHYGRVEGSVLAGGVTYFAFLSFFPVLALAFAAVGVVADVFPAARDSLTTALVDAFPGIIAENCDSSGCIELSTFSQAAGAATVFGVLGLLYAGLNWLSGLRTSLAVVFETPPTERRNIVVGKAVDLVALVALGVALIVSVSLSGAVAALIPYLLGIFGLDDIPGMSLLFGALGIALGVASSTLLFLIMFRLLAAEAEVSTGDRLRAALLSGVGFEVLKLLATTLVALALGNPAFATLGVSLVLLVWMNYFSRLALYGASWAAVATEVRARHSAVETGPVGPLEPPELGGSPPLTPVGARTRTDEDELGAFLRGLAVGAGVVGAAWAWVRHGPAGGP